MDQELEQEKRVWVEPLSSKTIESQATVGEKPAIIPSVTGRAWITGTQQHAVDPSAAPQLARAGPGGHDGG